jgi:CubicO group peptidase (beta-lactamase class C family)
MRFFTVQPELSRRRIKALADSLRRFRTLVIASFLSPRNGAGSIALSKDQRSLLEKIRRRKPAVAILTFGSPYIAADFPWARACVCAWGADSRSVAAAVEVLFGEIKAEGMPPVSIPGVVEMPRHGADSATRVPDVALAKAFRPVDSLVLNAVRRGAFPGGQLVVLKAGRVAHSACYGRLAYEEDSPPVTDRTLYDLASLTKVTATTTAAMKLYEEGKLKLDTAVAAYLPAFARGGKNLVTVRNLLLHNSGLPAFRAYEKFCATAEKAVDTILAEPPVYATGTRTVYSDLGIIALGKLIERITGMSLDRYADSAIFRSLGMSRTVFRPPASLRAQCAPTEMDTAWRKRLVQGEVHDERAALLGGVAGHAGLFSTAADLSHFVLMLMNEGSHEGRAYLKPATIAEFTRRQGSGSRALGWDTKSAGASSAGRYFGARSYGHTGFTGTSIWIDPDSRIAVIFLTNRVHPTRENKALLSLRSVLHDAVREALAGMGSARD